MNATTEGAPIAARVARVLTDLLGTPADIKPEVQLRADLNCDELDRIEIVMNLEEEFTILITEKEGDALTTVQSIIDLVTRKVDAIGKPANPRAPA